MPTLGVYRQRPDYPPHTLRGSYERHHRPAQGAPASRAEVPSALPHTIGTPRAAATATASRTSRSPGTAADSGAAPSSGARRHLSAKALSPTDTGTPPTQTQGEA